MENQRIRISKKMLKDSLIRLLKDNDIQKIAIQDICREAQVNRTTFYKYYGSQYDLMEDIQKDIFDELEFRLNEYEWSTDDANEGLEHILAYFENEREKCLRIINSTTDKDFAVKLFDLPVIKDLIKKNMLQDYPEEQVKYVHEFITQGSYAMIREWINSEDHASPPEMSRLIENLMSKLTIK